MNPADPIIACATPHGRAARALIRLSAPDLTPVLAPRLADPPLSARGISRAEFRLGAHTFPLLITRFPAPHSPTGQDAAELCIPGSPALVHRVIDAFLTAPSADAPCARLALPGEFTARAFLAGRITAEQAEGVQALIAARTDAEFAAAESLLSGDTGDAYRALADECATLLALVESGIDFTDQDDVVPIAPPDLAARIDELRDRIAPLVASAGADRARTNPVRIVLMGPPNAGKSTLFNRILGLDRSLVSDTPGATRDAIAERRTIHDLDPSASPLFAETTIELVDLAGLDESLALRSRADAASQRAAVATLASADVLVWCDPTGHFADPIPIPAPAPILRVRTKADLLLGGASLRPASTPGGTSLRPASSPGGTGLRPASASGGTGLRPVSFFGGMGFQPVTESLPVCALDGWNIAPVRRALADAARAAIARDHNHHAAATVLPRHHAALASALHTLTDARSTISPSRPARSPALASPELTATHLRAALDHLGAISGRIHPDDIIGRIFATFCVGK